jgi:hypothetical protein
MSSNGSKCIARSGIGVGAVDEVSSSDEVCLLSTFCCTSGFVTRQRGCCVLLLVLSCVCVVWLGLGPRLDNDRESSRISVRLQEIIPIIDFGPSTVSHNCKSSKHKTHYI